MAATPSTPTSSTTPLPVPSETSRRTAATQRRRREVALTATWLRELGGLAGSTAAPAALARGEGRGTAAGRG